MQFTIATKIGFPHSPFIPFGFLACCRRNIDLGFDLLLEQCMAQVEKLDYKKLLQDLGELMNPDLKTFVKTKLKQETLHLLTFYKDYPIFK